MWKLDKPIRMFAQPGGLYPGMVGNNITGQVKATLPTALAQIVKSGITAKICGNPVIGNGISRCRNLNLSTKIFDLQRSPGTLPNPDQPEAGKSTADQFVQFFIGNLIKISDLTLVFTRQLFQPDIG